MKVPVTVPVGLGPRIRYMVVPPPTSDIHVTVGDQWKHGYYTKGQANRLLIEDIQNYLDIEHVVLTSSGTMAIAIGIWAAKNKGYIKGPKVLVSSYTWESVPLAFTMAGCFATPGDVNLETWQLDYEKETAYPGGWDAVCLTDTFGSRASDEPDEPFFVDAAHGLGLRGIGDRGLFEAFSMAATKVVTAGEGGFITTSHADIAEEAARLARFCSRLPEASCILALNRLAHIEEELKRRRSHVNRYMERLGSHAKYQSTLNGHVYSIFGVRLSPEHLDNLCKPRDFAVRQYYNPPLNQCVNAEVLAESVVALPMAGIEHCDHISNVILGEE